MVRRLACLATVVLLCVSGSAVGARHAPPNGTDGLVRLMNVPGVTGFEHDVRALIGSWLPAWAKARTDEAGNLVLTIGQGAPHVLVAASLDEDGYFVSNITDGGYLRLQRISTGVSHRLFEQFHYGQPVMVRTNRGTFVPGVTSAASTHLQRGRDASSNAPKSLDDLWIDVGARDKAEVERLGVELLNAVSLRERAVALAGGRVAGPGAQARAGAMALVELVRQFEAAPAVKGTLTIAWTAQSVFGERGLARLAQQVAPDHVFLVARTPVSKEPDARGAAGRLGQGPIVLDSDKTWADRAAASGVMLQPLPGLRVPNTWPGKTHVVALPVLFAQSTVETVDASDVASLTSLLHAAAGLPGSARPSAAPLPAGPATPAAAKPTSASPLVPALATLVSAYGVAGKETPVREALAPLLPKWAKPEVDERGNLTVTFGAQAGRPLAFVAHLDEIGYRLESIEEDGTATVRKLGGFMDLLLEAHPVLVHTARGRVPAIVTPRANYLRATEGTPRPADLRLDFGTPSRAETEALGVAVGDTATVRKMLQPLAGTRVTARSLDDRAGMTALVAALSRLDPSKVRRPITFAWVVGEETGLVGSGFLAERLHPEYVFAVDTFVSSDSPVDPQRMALIPVGSGAVLRAIDNSSIAPPEAIARILATARAHKLPITPGTTGGGNDGSTFTRYGSFAAGLSWPGRYSHSPVEILDTNDLETLVTLIMAIVQEW